MKKGKTKKPDADLNKVELADRKHRNTEVAHKGPSKKRGGRNDNKIFQDLDHNGTDNDEIGVKTNLTAGTRGLNLQDVENEMPDFAQSQGNYTQVPLSNN